MTIERNEPIRFYEKGTLEAVTRWIATHHDGVAEWLKNVRRQYQVDRANVAENQRVAALLLQDTRDGKPARIGVLGEVILVPIPLLDTDGMILVKLHGIEAQGIWIESQEFTNQLMEKFRFVSSRTTPLVFVPFDKVDFIIGSLDSLSLSESGFGL
jgi:hypothetical protein